MKNKEELLTLAASFGILFCCVFFYYKTGIFGIDFPTHEVLKSIPISFGIWLLAAFLDPPKYRTILASMACFIFGSCVFTAAFLIFGRG